MNNRKPVTLSAEKETLNKRVQKELTLETDADLDAITAVIPCLEVIRIRTNSFTDGRIFSLGYSLRQRHNFKGRLIASGDILPDQFAYLKRCGFDQLESDGETDVVETWVLKGYQPAHY